MTNAELAEFLLRFANILEEQEENPYRIRAYRQAATSLKRYPDQVTDLIAAEVDLTIIPKIGVHLAEKLKQVILTGKQNFPLNKKAKPYPKRLRKKLRKPVTFRIYSLMHVIDRIIKCLQSLPDVKKIQYTSDFRRKKEIIGDVEIVIVTDDAIKIFNEFHKFISVKYIVATTANSTIVQLKSGTRLTLTTTTEDSFGAKLLQATGSESHYAALQKLAAAQNCRLTEKGLFKQRKKISGSSEDDIYHKLGLSYIPPELRENRGELEKAKSHNLPKLIELEDIRGDLHCHTSETDGTYTLEEMVEAAQKQGYEYVAITDHSQSLKITNGMDEKRLLQQIKLIDRLNEKFSNFTILKSMEIDILEDGSLDLSQAVLQELDLTVCSVHSRFRLSSEQQTERIIRAMDNPYFNILGHATGRLIKHRPPYEVDILRILQAAKERNCFIEVNAQPARLDINDIYCQAAKEIGVKVAISSDAHTTKGFSFMILGVNQARRGWLEAADVINTYPWPHLKKLLKRK